jgi:hypothetical protein
MKLSRVLALATLLTFTSCGHFGAKKDCHKGKNADCAKQCKRAGKDCKKEKKCIKKGCTGDTAHKGKQCDRKKAKAKSCCSKNKAQKS